MSYNTKEMLLKSKEKFQKLVAKLEKRKEYTARAKGGWTESDKARDPRRFQELLQDEIKTNKELEKAIKLLDHYNDSLIRYEELIETQKKGA